MNLIRHLRECTSVREAAPILSKLKAGPGIRKLVETSMLLSNSNDPQQRDHAYGFMDKAIQEILDNNNNGAREDGSEQSSDNVEPYSNVSKTSKNGENSMVSMQGITNQWDNNQSSAMYTGVIEPSVASELIQETPLDTNQMMRQMNHVVTETINNFYRKQILPFQKLVKQQREAIKYLSIKLEKNKRNRNSLDMAFKETTNSLTTQANIQMDNQRIPVAPTLHNDKYWQPLIEIHSHKGPTKDDIRNEIIKLNRDISLGLIH